MKKQVKEAAILNAQCYDCEGSGLYVGMLERDGAAVVCHSCKGTGKVELKYVPFTGKKEPRRKIVRVFKHNRGYVIGSGDGNNLEDFGGMPYEDWKNGRPFELGMEMRNCICPMWETSEKLNERCDLLQYGQRYTECPMFKHKEDCWKEYDRKRKGV